MAKLTELRVRTAKAVEKDLWLSDGSGLYLRVRKAGSKAWIIRRKVLGKTKIITVGHYPGLSLKEARLRAAEFQLRPDGTTTTIKVLVAKYLAEVVEKEHKRPELVSGYMDRAVLPALGNRLVRDVSRAELVNLLQAYSARGARTADQLRSNLKALFGYAVELGLRDSNPLTEVTRRVTGYTQVNRERVLTDDEIRMIWSWDGENAKVLRFLALTGLRISEARKGFRLGDQWHYSERVSKNGDPHWVHLSPLAIDQLPLPTCSATNIQAWLKRKLENLGFDNRFVPHDLRRTAATRMADAGVEPFIIERVLNHRLQGMLAVYNRAEYAKERIQASLLLEASIQRILETSAPAQAV